MLSSPCGAPKRAISNTLAGDCPRAFPPSPWWMKKGPSPVFPACTFPFSRPHWATALCLCTREAVSQLTYFTLPGARWRKRLKSVLIFQLAIEPKVVGSFLFPGSQFHHAFQLKTVLFQHPAGGDVLLQHPALSRSTSSLSKTSGQKSSTARLIIPRPHCSLSST